jgi:hypothetical protein
MPSMANITVKAANGTTDVIFVAKNPSSGDGTKALWRVDAAATLNSAKPSLEVSSKSNGDGSVRRVTGHGRYPFTLTDSTTGKISTDQLAHFSWEAVLPQSMPDSAIAEFVAQQTNLCVSTLMVSSLKEGFAPT